MSDTLSIIIVVLIIAIVLDGLRRARNARRNQVKLSKNARKADMRLDAELKVETSSELPSGGARRNPKRKRQAVDSSNVSEGPEQTSLDLDEPVPMLMDSIEQESAPPIGSEDALEPQLGSLDHLEDIEPAAEEKPPSPVAPEPTGKKSKLQFAADIFSREHPDPTESEDEERQDTEEILVINIMSKQGEVFRGEELLAVLTDLKLRFGQMGIFHRHLNDDGDAASIFSVANIVEPGIFDLTTIREVETPGLCLFLPLPSAAPAIEAYENLIQTARDLAHKLNGELKDENRSAMTSQTIEHGRQRVLEFERRHKIHR